ARPAHPWPHSGRSGEGRCDRYYTRRRGGKTCQMLRDQFLGFSETVEFNILVAADSVWGVGNPHRQGVIAVVELCQHLRDRVAIPRDQLQLLTAHFRIAKEVPARTTPRLHAA